MRRIHALFRSASQNRFSPRLDCMPISSELRIWSFQKVRIDKKSCAITAAFFAFLLGSCADNRIHYDPSDGAIISDGGGIRRLAIKTDMGDVYSVVGMCSDCERFFPFGINERFVIVKWPGDTIHSIPKVNGVSYSIEHYGGDAGAVELVLTVDNTGNVTAD